MANNLLSGVVVGTNSMKTINVQIEGTKVFKKVRKTLKSMNMLMVHDENQVAKVGDRVLVKKTRPWSALKHWELVSFVVKEDASENSEVSV